MATRTISNAGGNWNATGTWVEGVVPTAADDVVATATSGQLTLNVNGACRSIDFTNYVNTFTHAATAILSIGTTTVKTGNVALRFVAGMTYVLGSNSASQISFVSTSATQVSITMAGKTNGDLVFSSGSYIFQDTVSMSNATITHAAGTLNMNGKTVTAAAFSGNGTSTRTLTLGAATLNIFGTATQFSLNATGLTMTANTATIAISGGIAGTASPSMTFTGNVNLNGAKIRSDTTGTLNLIGTATTLTLGTLEKTTAGTISLAYNVTVTTLTLQGPNSASRAVLQTSAIGTARTVTATTRNLTNASFQGITAAGTAFSGTRLGDRKGNTNITFTTAATKYWVGGTGSWSDPTNHWATASGGVAGVNNAPLEQDPVVFDANSFSADGQTVTIDLSFLCAGITASLIDQNVTFDWTAGAFVIYGNLTWSSRITMTMAAAANTWLNANVTITCNGGSFGNLRFISSQFTGNTIQLGDDFIGGNQGLFSISSASSTFLTNGHNMTVGGIWATGTAASRTITLGASIITCTAANSLSAWDMGTGSGLTLNAGTSQVVIDGGNGTGNFGGKTYYRVQVNAGVTISILGTNTISNGIVAYAPCTIKFQAGVVTTLGGVVIDTVHNGSQQVTLNSSTPGTQATLTMSTPGALNETFLTVQDILGTTTGGATWTAGPGSVNSGNNTNWTFDAGPPPDVDVPIISIGTPTNYRISRVSGKDSTQFTWQVNEGYDTYEVRAMSDEFASRTSGTLIETGTSTWNANTDHTITLTGDEMNAAGLTDGSHLITVWVRDMAGNWSVYDPLNDAGVLFLGDLHAGRGTNATAHMNTAEADLVNYDVGILVQIGDMTEDGLTAQDTTAKGLTDDVMAPVVRTLVGNHDLESERSGAAAQAAWGYNGQNWTYDAGQMLIVGVSPDAHTGPGGNGSDPSITLTQATIDWLEAQLQAATKEVWIACHAPLGPGPLGSVDDWYVNPPTTIKAMLDQYPIATCWFSGHTHTAFSSWTIANLFNLGTRNIVNANCSAIAYVNPNDDLADPVCSLLALYREGGADLLIRDHAAQGYLAWPSGDYTKTLVAS